MSEQSVRVPVNKLVPFMEDACVAMGAPRDDARIIADVLITSDLWGVRSHGVAHLKMYYERMKAGLQLPVTQTTVVKDTPTTAVMDGGNGMGMVVGHRAMKLAMAEGAAVRPGRRRRPQLQPLRRRRLLPHVGGAGGPGRAQRHQRAPVPGADLRREAHAGHQPDRRRRADRRALPVHVRCRDLGRPPRQDRDCRPRPQADPRRVGDR